MASNQGSAPSAGAKVPVSVANADGIGPEITAASLDVTHGQIVGLLDRIPKAGIDVIKIENLYV
jgi:hypothetical protein